MIKNFKGVFFDLDGTLVDSKLDFDLMREELGFPKGVPLLEYLDELNDQNQINSAMQVILKHEMHGARESEIFEGVYEVLNLCQSLGIATAVLTRNCREATELTLDKFNLNFEHVITREDFPAKPNPDALHFLVKEYRLQSYECCYIGDYKFDLETAKNAKMKAGLFLNDKNQVYQDMADFSFRSFFELL